MKPTDRDSHMRPIRYDEEIRMVDYVSYLEAENWKLDVVGRVCPAKRKAAIEAAERRRRESTLEVFAEGAEDAIALEEFLEETDAWPPEDDGGGPFPPPRVGSVRTIEMEIDPDSDAWRPGGSSFIHTPDLWIDDGETPPWEVRRWSPDRMDDRIEELEREWPFSIVPFPEYHAVAEDLDTPDASETRPVPDTDPGFSSEVAFGKDAFYDLVAVAEGKPHRRWTPDRMAERTEELEREAVVRPGFEIDPVSTPRLYRLVAERREELGIPDCVFGDYVDE